jgi:hypothetical protein
MSRWRSQTGKTLACPPNAPHKQGFAAGMPAHPLPSSVREVYKDSGAPVLPGVVQPAKIMPSTLGRVTKESGAPTGPPRNLTPAFLRPPQREQAVPRIDTGYVFVPNTDPRSIVASIAREALKERQYRGRARHDLTLMVLGGLLGILIGSALLVVVTFLAGVR